MNALLTRIIVVTLALLGTACGQSESGSAQTGSATVQPPPGQPPPSQPPGSGATINAASCSRSDVSSAISSANDGDTVAVPAGSCTWSSNIEISSKNVLVLGAGAGSTTIATGTFTLTDSGVRIAGFTFNIGTAGGFVIEGASRFRIDHNAITRSDYDVWLTAYGQHGTNRPKGLIDNNNITRGRIVHFGEDTSTGGRYTWAAPLDMGTDNAIYIEDNTITYPDGSTGGSFLNTTDGNMGCRLVIRFNTIHGGRFESHALQGSNTRGCMLWEYYNNKMTNPATPNFRPFLIRGGTGVVFNNTTDGRFTVNEIHIDNPRTHSDSVIAQMGAWGACNGASFVDGNTPGGEGYLCRDQIGAGQDEFLWDYSNSVPAQAKVPAYFWRNIRTDTNAELLVSLNCVGSSAQCTRQSTKHIVRNRDYFAYSASFDGTSGVGQGTLANRPTTCTPGVAYWATDQGEWNSKNPGNDGQLYKCTATNTWSLYYKPYAYPHPLQSGIGTSMNPFSS